jgi:hypothetical protein
LQVIFMKRISILLIIVTLIASIAGCSQPAYERTTGSTDTAENQLNLEFTTPSLLSYANPQHNDTIKMMLINSPPTPPVNVRHTIANVDYLTESAVILSDVPSSEWTYGCTATSAGMLFGYYDRTGYPNMYTGPTNGGICPLTDLGQGIPGNSRYPISGSCYIIATENGLDGISSNAHADDYWISYTSAGPDPWEGNWVEHNWEFCIADFLGTNQWKWDYSSYPGTDGTKDRNTDGATTYWYTSDGSKLYDWYPGPAYGLPATSCCHGMKLFAESRGYTVETNYNQLTDNQNSNGFTFAEFQAEINGGRPVLIHVVGHTMVGIGYDTATNSIYIHDTWDNAVHSMTWGGSYAGMDLYAVTVIHLATPTEYNLTVASTSGGSVIIPGEGTYTRYEGLVVDLVATPDAGYRFDEWTGDVGTIADVYAASTTITMNGDYSVTAEFVKTYDLTTSSTAGGSVTNPGEGTYTYDEATVVDLVATPNAGYRFDEWTGDVGTVPDVNDPTTTITMNGDYSVTANFCELSTYQFIYDVPDNIVACEDAEMPVTFQTDVLGCFGYDNVRYKFYATGPGDVTFKVTDLEEVQHVFVNSGYWAMEVGLDLPADYSETNNWTVHFSTPGEYNATFSLVDATTDEIIAGLTEMQPLTVEPGDILQYYRSLHEPADEVTTLDLLAAADDWIADIAMPCFGEPITMAEMLMLADEWIAGG